MAAGKSDTTRKQYKINCIEDGLSVLAILFISEEGKTLNDLYMATGISKNKTFRLLTSFVMSGVLIKDRYGKYSLGNSTYITARKILARDELTVNVRPVLESLAVQLDEAVYFARPDSKGLVMTDMVDCRQKVRGRSMVGTLLCGGTDEGVTVSHGGIDPELTTVAMTLKNCSGMVSGALVIVGPTFRLSDERIGDEIIPLLQRSMRQLPMFTAVEKKREPVVLRVLTKQGGRGATGQEPWPPGRQILASP